jgi:6-phosphogluconolactonase/glucosamine-6-phosphate isomerase/deaminase
MKKVDYPVFFISGENKKGALEKALKIETRYEEIPARVILDMKKPIIFTDIEIT